MLAPFWPHNVADLPHRWGKLSVLNRIVPTHLLIAQFRTKSPDLANDRPPVEVCVAIMEFMMRFVKLRRGQFHNEPPAISALRLDQDSEDCAT